MNLNLHPKLPPRQFVMSLKRNQAAVAALCKAAVPVPVPQFTETVHNLFRTNDATRISVPPIYRFDGLSKDLRLPLDWTTVATLRDAMVPTPVSQLMGSAQDISKKLDAIRAKRLDAIRAAISLPRRFNDLRKGLCLRPEFDVYAKEWAEYGKEPDHLIRNDLTIEGAVSVEDELIEELLCSDLPDAEQIVQGLKYSDGYFHNGNFNDCLVKIRVVLETVARQIAVDRFSNHPGKFNLERWGGIIHCLRDSGFITKEKELELTRVYKTISSPAHHLTIVEENSAISSRGEAIALCYFLVKKFNVTEARA